MALAGSPLGAAWHCVERVGRRMRQVVGGGEIMTSITAEMHLIPLDAQCLFL